MAKQCFRCGKKKPINHFYAHPQMEDGHLGKCKTCTKEDVAKRIIVLKSNPVFIEKERERGREKYHRLYKPGAGQQFKKSGVPKYQQKNKLTRQLYYARFPEKKVACIKSRHLKRVAGLCNHHWSYRPEHWLDVLQLSQSNHVRLHRHMTYDQERMQYRTVDGILLDTREAHEKYFESLSDKL